VSFAGDVRGPEIDRIFVFWSPEACIADSMTDDGLSKVVSGNTQVSWRLYSNALYKLLTYLLTYLLTHSLTCIGTYERTQTYLLMMCIVVSVA